jgi:aspartate 1-decarboxylase
MKRVLLKSKIHRATVTDASLHYEGSVTIDPLLMDAVNIVHAIAGQPGSGVICLNGAAARLVQVGDLVIICSYAEFSEDEVSTHQPRIVLVDAQNRIVRSCDT